MKTACKMVICLLVCLALSSCSRPVPDPIPDGTWTCEEESITLLLAGNDGIGLWNGSLITKSPYDWPGELSLCLCPRQDGGPYGTSFAGNYRLNADQTAFTALSAQSPPLRYHFVKTDDTAPALSGTWTSDSSPLILRFTEGTVSMGEDGQGNLIRIGCTKDSPHIWATRNGEHSMESVLLFARYELREGRLICIPYRGDVPIVFEQTE